MGKKLRLNQVGISNDLVFTKTVGNVSAGTTISKDTSVQEVLEQIFGADQNPTITQPSASLEVVLVRDGEESVISDKVYVECGEDLVVKVGKAELNPGAYQYGPTPTGVTAKDTLLKLFGNEEKLQDLTVGEDCSKVPVGEGLQYHVQMMVSHSAGSTPLTYLKKEYAAGTIAAGTKTAVSPKIVAYRPAFYGFAEVAESIQHASHIRALTKASAPLEDESSVVLSAVADADNYMVNSNGEKVPIDSQNLPKFMIIAVPTADNVTPASAKVSTTMGLDIIEELLENKSVVQIPDAAGNNEEEYTVFFFEANFKGDEIIDVTFTV